LVLVSALYLELIAFVWLWALATALGLLSHLHNGVLAPALLPFEAVEAQVSAASCGPLLSKLFLSRRLLMDSLGHLREQLPEQALVLARLVWLTQQPLSRHPRGEKFLDYQVSAQAGSAKLSRELPAKWGSFDPLRLRSLVEIRLFRQVAGKALAGAVLQQMLLVRQVVAKSKEAQPQVEQMMAAVSGLLLRPSECRSGKFPVLLLGCQSLQADQAGQHIA
jgi:hypothetical protein